MGRVITEVLFVSCGMYLLFKSFFLNCQYCQNMQNRCLCFIILFIQSYDTFAWVKLFWLSIFSCNILVSSSLKIKWNPIVSVFSCHFSFLFKLMRLGQIMAFCCLLFYMLCILIPEGVSSCWLHVSCKETENCRADRGL